VPALLLFACLMGGVARLRTGDIASPLHTLMALQFVLVLLLRRCFSWNAGGDGRYLSCWRLAAPVSRITRFAWRARRVGAAACGTRAYCPPRRYHNSPGLLT